MATLFLNDLAAPMPSLREWLDGEWGLLISCPGDFEDQSLERDRWLEVMQAAFAASGVRPVALRYQTGGLDQGWVSTLVGDRRCVGLAPRAAADVATRRLRDRVMALQQERFALAVDSALFPRAVVTYRRDAYSPRMSPLDLLARVTAVRRESADVDAASDAGTSFPSPWTRGSPLTSFPATMQ